jgi:hypothetical protein
MRKTDQIDGLRERERRGEREERGERRERRERRERGERGERRERRGERATAQSTWDDQFISTFVYASKWSWQPIETKNETKN